ncbi:hypothetical protein [[Phormidium] sp. ETS-05]|uniref:hypothetical protein n=1 Tax=[Phormidium] sp. ETS-05 TaxID=222819 RepID=UPI0018EEED6D|nr:hypothetical protein [[Phormidium] sp. ETS-05]
MLDINNLFNETYYLAENPDVAAAVSSGAFSSGLQHFSWFGQFELRDPSALFSHRYYLAIMKTAKGQMTRDKGQVTRDK